MLYSIVQGVEAVDLQLVAAAEHQVEANCAKEEAVPMDVGLPQVVAKKEVVGLEVVEVEHWNLVEVPRQQKEEEEDEQVEGIAETVVAF